MWNILNRVHTRNQNVSVEPQPDPPSVTPSKPGLSSFDGHQFSIEGRRVDVDARTMKGACFMDQVWDAVQNMNLLGSMLGQPSRDTLVLGVAIGGMFFVDIPGVMGQTADADLPPSNQIALAYEDIDMGIPPPPSTPQPAAVVRGAGVPETITANGGVRAGGEVPRSNVRYSPSVQVTLRDDDRPLANLYQEETYTVNAVIQDANGHRTTIPLTGSPEPYPSSSNRNWRQYSAEVSHMQEGSRIVEIQVDRTPVDIDSIPR